MQTREQCTSQQVLTDDHRLTRQPDGSLRTMKGCRLLKSEREIFLSRGPLRYSVATTADVEPGT